MIPRSAFTTHDRVGRYYRINSVDTESEPRQSSEGSDGIYYDDDLPLLYKLAEKSRQLKERRGPRKSKRLLALAFALVLALLLLAFSLVAAVQVAQQREQQNQLSSHGNTSSLLMGMKCDRCITKSALPEYIPAFKSHDSFSNNEAMQSWISRGQIPMNNSLDFSQYARLDGITFWVNGTDPRHKAARSRFAGNVSQIDHPRQQRSSKKRATSFLSRLLWNLQNDDNRFREQNELLYSLRSAKESLGDQLRTLHIISTDYWDNNGTNALQGIQDRIFQGRRGQIPQWLNVSSGTVAFGGEKHKSTPAIRIHHDWETFAPLVGVQERIEEWKMKRLPSFDSIAAEAVLGVNISGLGETSFLASDDMFLGQALSTADFYTPLYGSVLHLDMHNMVTPSAHPWSLGEMVGLRWSAFQLQKRFGTKRFPYPTHVHKALSKPLLIESRMMFRHIFQEATSHRFRAKGRLANSHMLLYGMIVERHREALLWSFLVSKIDIDGDGWLNDNELQSAFDLIGTNGSKDIIGRLRQRDTVELINIHKALDSISFPRPLASQYTFSSLDGFGFAKPSAEFTRATGLELKDGPTRYQPEEYKSDKHSQRFQHDFCRVKINICWPGGVMNGSRNTANIFTRFAFEKPECGDCLITHLISQSGKAGLEAFLPSHGSRFPNKHPQNYTTVPAQVPAHLPLHSEWKQIDFSLSSVAATNHIGWTRRNFSIHLIQRYNYVIANSPANFEQLTSPSSAKSTFAKLQKGGTAFICLNDDIRWNLGTVRSLLQLFLESMWPSARTRLPFEKQHGTTYLT